MVQQFLIAGLLAASVFYLVRTVYVSFRTGKACGTGCGKCQGAAAEKIIHE